MIENQSISKKERIDLQPGCDMLSELPLSIIHIILAHVPIRDAVKTCILSRQWRYTWASLPHLVFKNDRAIKDYKSRDEFEICMEGFITHVLFLHKGPIHKFKVSVPFRRNRRSIGVWLRCLSMKDIRELIIDNHIGSTGMWKLHSIIYSCKKLIKLELNNCELDPPPTTLKAFLFLRCLWLKEVHLSTKDVEHLVANCPLLEEFSAIECGLVELRISAPKLKVLRLQDCYNELSVYAPLLAELSVELEDDDFDDIQHDNSACNYSNFMGGFTNLEKLSGHLYFTKYLSMGLKSCHPTLVFHHLKDIELTGVDFEDIKPTSVVTRLIVGSPKLEKLKIENEYYDDKDDDESEVPHLCLIDFGRAPNFKLEKLSVVEFIFVSGVADAEMTFTKFLLEHSPVLKTMIFAGISLEDEEFAIAELEGCIRASPNVKLVYLPVLD